MGRCERIAARTAWVALAGGIAFGVVWLGAASCSNPPAASPPLAMPRVERAVTPTPAANSAYPATRSSSATTPVPTTAASPAARLTVKVVDLRNHSGQLIFGVFTSADGFPSSQTKAAFWQIKAIDADSVTFSCSLPPGVYGASVLHDENRNNKLDLNLLGIPREGYGVTNNPKPRMRSATFKEATFTLPPEGADLTISVQYF